MPKSQLYAYERVCAGASLIGRFPRGIIWGTAAGAVIGAGMSLNIDLLYGSATGATCAVILIFAFLGALLGHVMSRLFSDSNVGYAVHAAAVRQHRITETPAQMIDLTDYQTLKAKAPKQGAPLQEACATMIPSQKTIHAEARF